MATIGLRPLEHARLLSLWLVLAALPLAHATDSGGDSCSYYEDVPHHCGCCDTPTFDSATCSACQTALPDANGTWWTWVFQTWPQKARTFLLPNRAIQASLPMDFAQRWPHLERIDLSYNKLTGDLPRQLGDVVGLVDLDLSFNQLSGPLPSEFRNLTSLENLYLNDNQLSGRLPAELGNLSRLENLYLNDNQLSGSLPPEFGNLARLERLYLDDNRLSGSLPPQLGKLSKLQRLYLNDNQLSGSLPPEFGDLSKLQRLYLGSNQLSNSLPPELGNLSKLERLYISSNRLSGAPPQELGKLANLERLYLDDNLLSGSLPPELGDLANLERLYLNGNQFSGLPAELGRLMSLERLYLNDNQLSGRLPSEFGNLRNLELFYLHGNRLSGSLPTELGNLRRLQELQLNENQLSGKVPAELGNLVSLWKLDLRSNRLHGSLPQELGNLVDLIFLDLSFNQLSGDMPASLGKLQVLQELYLSHNLLHGDLPPELGRLQLRILDLSANQLSGNLTVEHFSSWRLTSLDLSENRIAAVLAPPPPQLVDANLSGNALRTLDGGWWSRGSRDGSFLRVDARHNPELRLAVRSAVNGLCPVLGVRELTANTQDWSERPGTSSECTSLCPLENSRFLVDGTINGSMLCRCREGQGIGLDCSPCSGNSYSSLIWENGQFRRRCLACPTNSFLAEGQGQCFGDCQCTAGFYMVQMNNGSVQDVGTTPCDRLAPQGKCVPCGLFKTSQPGSRKAADCFCNSNISNGGWAELLEREGRCGCPEGSHMNFAARSCVPCRNEENCGDWTRSLAPPRIKAGFWVAPPPPQGADGTFGNFSQHSIWRCQGASSCPGNFEACGWNRTGTACSLCRQGYFATFSGRCEPCPLPYTDTRRLLATSILACTIFPALALFQLKTDKGESKGLGLSLKPVRTSIKQLLKFAQILGLLALFRVEWPPVAKSALGIAQIFSLDIAAFTGVACLDSQQQQSMTLELTFRWTLPLAGVAITCLAALLVTVCGRVLGPICIRCRPGSKARIERLSSLRLLDVLRVLLFFLHLFFPSLLKNALIPLICSPSPNGKLTMNRFPSEICWSAGADSNASFWRMAAVGLGQSVLLSLGFPLLLFFAWKRVDASRTSTVLRQRRRWWAFLFVEFRPRRTSWALVAVCKDILLNVVVVLLPGLGTAQLLVTAVVSIAYSCRAFWVSPYPDASNSLLETCLAAAVASLCLFSAGMGFQSESDVPDLGAYVAEGREGSGYLRRSITLVCLQCLSLLPAAVILTLQLLLAFPWSRRCVPACLQPLGRERRGEWAQLFTRAIGLDGGPLPRALADFDEVEFSAFQQAVLDAPAVIGALATVEYSNECGVLKMPPPAHSQDLEALQAKTARLEAKNAALLGEIEGLQVAVLHRDGEIEQLRRRVRGALSVSLSRSL